MTRNVRGWEAWLPCRMGGAHPHPASFLSPASNLVIYSFFLLWEEWSEGERERPHEYYCGRGRASLSHSSDTVFSSLMWLKLDTTFQ